MDLNVLKIVIAFKAVWPNADEVTHVNVLQHLAITEFKDVNNFSITNLSALKDYPNLMDGKEVLCTYNDFMLVAEQLEHLFNELSISKQINAKRAEKLDKLQKGVNSYVQALNELTVLST